MAPSGNLHIDGDGQPELEQWATWCSGEEEDEEHPSEKGNTEQVVEEPPKYIMARRTGNAPKHPEQSSEKSAVRRKHPHLDHDHKKMAMDVLAAEKLKSDVLLVENCDARCPAGRRLQCPVSFLEGGED